MGQGFRAILALVVAFAAYRVVMIDVSSAAGVVFAVLLGVGAYVGVWLFTARWARSKS